MADWKGGRGQKIERLYAWIATEPDGGEGICGARMMIDGIEMFVPLVGADRARIESYRYLAEMITRQTGCPVRLVEFDGRHDQRALGDGT